VTAESFHAECDVRIEASPETVFEFFVVGEKMTLWKGVRAELDPRPGGIYRVEVIPGQAIAVGEYVEVSPPHRVVFTWGWEGDVIPVPPGSSTVEITLTPDGDGTHLQLRHTGLPSQDQVTEHTNGWTHYLSRLAVASAGGDPGPDPSLEGEPN
jgi:uncharacterized protein YndB with AHSA1/START domain